MAQRLRCLHARTKFKAERNRIGTRPAGADCSSDRRVEVGRRLPLKGLVVTRRIYFPILHNFKREQHAEILRDLARIFESGGLKPVLDDNNFSLEQAGQADARFMSGQGIGKVVIDNSQL
ncbi:zinc-binding dehydrogenase [Mariniblastus sp.]|nr:zinc-binding dehydrogenase [Mariniblastus sp.]